MWQFDFISEYGDFLKKEFIEQLSVIVGCEKILIDEPMSRHTSFKVGGPADIMFLPSSAGEIISVLNLCKSNDIPFTVIGNGSNLLVSDKGIRGVVIKIGKNMSSVALQSENVIYAQSGASLAMVASVALNNNLAGFEFASGIPGTVGGAMLMNAGAYGGEIKDVAVAGEFLTFDGEIIKLEGDTQGFGYRKSAYEVLDGIVLGAWFKLEKVDSNIGIKELMADLNKRRKDKQPLEYGSAGSTFKRPEGMFAGKLIEDCGLKGYTVGGASVSEKHAGFVINTGGATCDDVLSVIRHVRKTVSEKFGVVLELEVKLLGEDIKL